MSKKVEVNSPYFMSIHAAQNNIPEGDGALILPLPTPAGVLLRSGAVAVCKLHLTIPNRSAKLLYLQRLLRTSCGRTATILF